MELPMIKKCYGVGERAMTVFENPFQVLAHHLFVPVNSYKNASC
jgi:hypothetical protein